jgi:hypothetical protein
MGGLPLTHLLRSAGLALAGASCHSPPRENVMLRQCSPQATMPTHDARCAGD